MEYRCNANECVVLLILSRIRVYILADDEWTERVLRVLKINIIFKYTCTRIHPALQNEFTELNVR